MSDGTKIDYLHDIVKYILGKTTDEGKEVMKAADEIERLETSLLISKKKHELAIERIAKLEAALSWLAGEVERDHELGRLSVDSEDCAKSARAALQEDKPDED